MKITNILPAIVVALTLFASSCAKDIVDTTGTISGTTKDYDSRQTLADCHIALSPGGVSTTTNSTGTFEFPSLEPGDYSLLITKNGYKDNTQTVTVVSGKVSQMDIFMQAKSPFEVSETNYDYGDLQDTKEFFFFNNCDQDCAFTISSIPVWLSFSKTSGTVKAMGNEAVTAVVDRSKVQEGEYSQNVAVEYSGIKSGVVMIAIKMSKVIPSAPTVSIASAAENIKENSFEISGTIRATGGNQITAYGHCWSTSPEPTINDSRTNLGNTKDLLTFKSTAENLSTYTTYYVRAYAQNALGVSYSDQTVVMTQDTETDKWDGTIATSFAGGSGTSVDPYIIKTGGQLLLAKDYPTNSFVLANSIDLDNKNWLPYSFSGNLDGKGFSVRNLNLNRTSDNQGLFSVLEGAHISNLTIVGAKIIAGNYNNIGTLAGDFQYGEITNCHAILNQDSQLLGKSSVGGLIGSMGNGYADSKIIGSCSVNNDGAHNILGEENVGGILGFMREGYNGQIENCVFTGNLKGSSKVGGIVGYEKYGKLNLYYCSVTGSIEGNSYAGGIFGSCDHNGYGCTYIYSSRANVSINVSNGYAGGIFGGNSRFMNIIACYSDGTISSSNSSCNYICGIGVGADCELSYSTMTSTLSNYKQLGYMNSSKDCTGTTVSDNITASLRECYSSYANYYNFNNTWIWTGTVGGKEKSVSCPRLNWE